MTDIIELVKYLKQEHVQFISGVPDTLLNDFCLEVEKSWDPRRHVIAANEGNSIGLASGYFLTTNSVPLVYMQNSGIGNTVNPLLSLTNREVYSIPMVLLIGWRGKPGSNDWPQHTKQGELTPELMKLFDIPHREIEQDEIGHVKQCFDWAFEQAKAISAPVALIAGKNILAKGEKDKLRANSPYTLTREEAIKAVVDHYSDDTIFVASTGRATRELFHILKEEQSEQASRRSFLNVGAMGHTSSIAMGIALSNPESRTICFDGDAAVIMHMGALSIGGSLDLNNYLHVVVNNGLHESVGGQQSTGLKTNLTDVAKSCGFNTLSSFVSTSSEALEALDELEKLSGPGFLEIRIRPGMRADLPRLIFQPLEAKKELQDSFQ